MLPSGPVMNCSIRNPTLKQARGLSLSDKARQDVHHSTTIQQRRNNGTEGESGEMKECWRGELENLCFRQRKEMLDPCEYGLRHNAFKLEGDYEILN